MKHKVVYCHNYGGLDFYINGLIDPIRRWLEKHNCPEDKIDDYLQPWLSKIPRHDPLLVELAEDLKENISQFDQYCQAEINTFDIAEIDGDEYYLSIGSEGDETLVTPDMMIKIK